MHSSVAHKSLGSLRITNINGNINTNVQNLFKTGHAALIWNRFFTFEFMFPFMFVIRKLPIAATHPYVDGLMTSYLAPYGIQHESMTDQNTYEVRVGLVLGKSKLPPVRNKSNSASLSANVRPIHGIIMTSTKHTRDEPICVLK